MVNDTVVWGEMKRAIDCSNNLSDGSPKSSGSSSNASGLISNFRDARLLVEAISKISVASSRCDQVEESG